MFSFLGQIFFDGRDQRGIVDGLERALIAERGEFFRERVRGEQARQDPGVMRVNAALVAT